MTRSSSTRRAGGALAAVGLALGLSACEGSVEPATHIQATQAQLNARGRTNDGPASWWWEYSSSRSTLEADGGTEICGSPPEPDGRCGPASSNDYVNLSVVVTGLTPATTYHFRACAQDVNDTGPTCGGILDFTTAVGNSTAAVDGQGTLNFVAAPGTNQNLRVTRFTDTDGVARYKVEDVSTDPSVGHSVVPGASCAPFSATQTRDDAVKCTAGPVTRIRATLDDGSDTAVLDPSVTIGATLLGGAGQDSLTGSSGTDSLNGGPGAGDSFAAGAGSDTIGARDGEVDGSFSCGESPAGVPDSDLVTADPGDPVTASPTDCEAVQR